MNKKQLTKNLIHYQFEPDQGKHFGFNIFALTHLDKVLLIDTGYEKHAQAVQEDLTKNNLILEKVIITHFHPDHIFGLKVLPNVEIYGSAYFQTTLNLWTDKKDHKTMTPSFQIHEETSFSFYDHKIKLIPLPGHSACEMLVIVNETYLFVGDEIMSSNEGKPLLPSVGRKEFISRHLVSLETLKSFKGYIVIPSHGKIIKTSEGFQNDLDNRINYLKTIVDSKKQLSYEEATKNCKTEFLHQEWFRGVYDE